MRTYRQGRGGTNLELDFEVSSDSLETSKMKSNDNKRESLPELLSESDEDTSNQSTTETESKWRQLSLQLRIMKQTLIL